MTTTARSAPSLQEAVRLCLNTPEFMREYRRLTGHALGLGGPLDRMIDEATGRLDHEAWQFFDFVRDCVWLPVVATLAASR